MNANISFFTKSKDENGFNKISTMIGKLLFLHYDINSNCGDGNISIGIEDSYTKSEIQIDRFIDNKRSFANVTKNKEWVNISIFIDDKKL